MAKRGLPSPKPPTRRRGPTLTRERVEGIASVIRAWEGRLTWPGLCDAVQRSTGARYTRQALGNHLPIRAAYETYTSRSRPAMAVPLPETAGQKRIRLMEAENRELRKVQDTLLEKFARWAYNASSRGLDEAYLDQALPTIHRAGNR